MRKYWAITRASLQETVAYRGPMLIWLVGNILQSVVMVCVWQATKADNLIGGYTKAELVNYYIASLFLSWLVLWYPFDYLFKEIRDGQIVLSTLIKPISCFISTFGREVGWHIISSVVGLITSLILFYSFSSNTFWKVPVVNLLFLIPALLIAILVTFSFTLNMSLLAFWFIDVGAIGSFFWIGRSVLGGATIPISFLPFWIKDLAVFLPFRYMFSFPLEIFFNKLTMVEIFQGLLIGIIWVVSLYYIYRYLWDKGRRVYSAFGQ